MCCSKSDYYVRTLKLIENGFEPEEAKISGKGAIQSQRVRGVVEIFYNIKSFMRAILLGAKFSK